MKPWSAALAITQYGAEPTISIVAGNGPDNQIVVTGLGTTVVAGTAGNATISLTTGDTVTALAGTQNLGISAAAQVYIDLTGNTGLNGVIGSSGDTIVAGRGTTNVEGVNGGMLIKVGAAGRTNVSGSGNPSPAATPLSAALVSSITIRAW